MMRRMLSLSLVLAACGGGESTTDPTATVDTTTGATTTGATTPGTTQAPGTTTGEPTTADPTADPSSTSGPGPTTTEATTAVETTGPGFDCAAIEAGPFAPELLWSGYDGSEDLGFDGAGRLALKRGGQVVLVTADQQETVLDDGLPQAFGTRFSAGDLLVALPQSGELVAISPDGVRTTVVTGLKKPNGLHVDLGGVAWLTEFEAGRVVRLDATYASTTVYEGPEAASANGVVLDPRRSALFFTNYGAGRLLRIAVDVGGMPAGEPVEVATVGGAKLDGLTLDDCGHVYAVDQGNSRLYRARLDDGGVLVDEVELLAEFASGVANAQFGRGDGFDPTSLYASGNPGDVYRIAVGVPGAAPEGL